MSAAEQEPRRRRSSGEEQEPRRRKNSSEEEEETLKINLGTDTAAVLVLLRTKKSVIYL
jgi:hypothetical protein